MYRAVRAVRAVRNARSAVRNTRSARAVRGDVVDSVVVVNVGSAVKIGINHDLISDRRNAKL